MNQRKRITIAVAGAAAAGVVAGAALLTTPLAGAADTAGPPAPPSEFVQTLVSCADLKVDLLVNREHNTNIDPEHGLLMISTLDDLTHEDRTITVDYATDKACQLLPTLRQVIDHAVATYEEANQEECVSLAEVYNSGQTTVREQPIDRDALGRHIARWC